MLDLLLLLLDFLQLAKRKDKKSFLQNRGRIAMECPLCHAISAGTHFSQMERNGKNWQCAREIFRCANCGRDSNADSFRNDDGIMKIRAWDCPACQQLNPASSYICLNCHTRLV